MGAATRALRETVTGLPRQFWWLWTSTLINRLGGFVVTFLALYLTVQRGYSASYAGLVAALYGLGGAAGAVLGGVLSDRLGRRATLLAAQLGTAAATCVLGLVADPLAIAGFAVLMGLGGSASRPALQAMIVDLVPPQDRVRAFSLNYWATNIGFGVAAAAAGFIASVGYLWLFFGDALTTVLCALVVFAKVRETLPSRERRLAAHGGYATAGAGATAGEGRGAPEGATRMLDVLRDRRFMGVVGLTFLFGCVMKQANSTLPVDMGVHGLSSEQFGMAAAVNGVVIVVLQIPLTRLLRRRTTASVLAVGALLMGWGFGLTTFAGTFGLYALTVAVWTLGEIMYTPASMAAVAELAPTAARGRFQGMYTLAWSAAAFAGPLAGGLAYDGLGREAVWTGCALLGTVTALGYYVLLVRMPAKRAAWAQESAGQAATGPTAEAAARPAALVEDAADPAAPASLAKDAVLTAESPNPNAPATAAHAAERPARARVRWGRRVNRTAWVSRSPHRSDG